MSYEFSLIRRASSEDTEALLDLFEEVVAEGLWIGGELPYDRDVRLARRNEQLQEESYCSVVACDGELLVGEASLARSRGVAELGMMVKKTWRQRGVGSALVEAAIEWARGCSLDKISLQVLPHNDAAIALYEKFGFVREGYLRRHRRRNNGEVWDIIQMGLLLDGGRIGSP